MGVGMRKNGQAGFAGLEAVLLVVIVAAIVGVGAYVLHQRHVADKTLSVGTGAAGNAPQGTTTSIDQITEQDAKTESSVDNSADASFQQDATGPNAAVNSLGGAYNEANY